MTQPVELIDYLNILWRKKAFIAAGVCFSVITAFVATMFMPKVYKSSAVLLLRDSKIASSGDARTSFENYEISAMTYMGILKNKSAMTSAIDRFRLNELYNITLGDMERLVNVEIMKKSRLFKLSVEFLEPNMAMEIANFLAQRGIEFNEEFGEKGKASDKDFINGLMDSAKVELDASEKELLEFKENSQLASLKKKVEILLTRKGVIENEILEIQSSIVETESKIINSEDPSNAVFTSAPTYKGQKMAKEAMDKADEKFLKFKENFQISNLRRKVELLNSRKAEMENGIYSTSLAIAENIDGLKKAEEEFRKRDKTIRLKRIIAEDPLYHQTLANAAGEDSKKISTLGMYVETPDPIFEHLEKKVVDIALNLDSLYAKKSIFEKELEEKFKELKKFQDELARKEVELEWVTRSYEMVKANYVQLVPVLNTLYGKLTGLKAELKDNTSQLKSLEEGLAGKEMFLENLERRYRLNVDTYQVFAKRYAEVAMQVAAASQDLKIIDPAVVPSVHSRPKLKLNVSIAAIAGLIFSLFIAFLLNHMERGGMET